MNLEENRKKFREQMEVRIVALLMGETSDFETAEIQEAIKKDPSLAAFHDELRRTIDLVREASRQVPAEAKPDAVQPRLSPERREALFSKFKETKVVELPSSRRAFNLRRWFVPVSIAAGFVLLAAAAMWMNIPGYTTASSSVALDAQRGSTVHDEATLRALQEKPVELRLLARTESSLQAPARGAQAENRRTPVPLSAGEPRALKLPVGGIRERGRAETVPAPKVFIPASEADEGKLNTTANFAVNAPATASRPASGPAVEMAPLPIQFPLPTLKGTPDDLPSGPHIEPLPGTRIAKAPASPSVPAPPAVAVAGGIVDGSVAVNPSSSSAGLVASDDYQGASILAFHADGDIKANNGLGIVDSVQVHKYDQPGIVPNTSLGFGGNGSTPAFGNYARDAKSSTANSSVASWGDGGHGQLGSPAERAKVAEIARIGGQSLTPNVDRPIGSFKNVPAATRQVDAGEYKLEQKMAGPAASSEYVGASIAEPKAQKTEPVQLQLGKAFSAGYAASVQNPTLAFSFDSSTVQDKEKERYEDVVGRNAFGLIPVTPEGNQAGALPGLQEGRKSDPNRGQVMNGRELAQQQAPGAQRWYFSALGDNRSAADPSSQNSPVVAGEKTGRLAEMSKGDRVEGLQEKVAEDIAGKDISRVQTKANEPTSSVLASLSSEKALKSKKEEPRLEAKQKEVEEAMGSALRLKRDVGGSQPRPAVAPTPQPEITTRDNAFSTFSLNVSDVSFKLAASSLENGAMPEPANIRVEEFVNAFNYRDPAPQGRARLAFAWERAHYPFAHNQDLLRFSIQTAARGREAQKPLNLVLLMDCSGSMERPDRVAILQQALRVLAQKLQPQDKVSVVAFARTARLLVDGMAGGKPKAFLDKVLDLNPQGGTNLEDALGLAYATAAKHFMAQGVNRVILLTDGAANLGNVDPEMLKQTVVTNRGKGIALDCFGIGWEGYNDDLLEVLSRNGDGRYGFLDHPEDAAPEFANQLAGALSVAASDVKTQVEFNPQRVQSWRQIGYAKHQLTKEQFRDNTVDAAEIAASESGNALYAVQTKPEGNGPIGVVRVRYKVPGTGEYVEQEWTIPYQKAPALEQASSAMKLAASAAAFGEWLSRSPYAAEVRLGDLQRYLAGVPESFAPDPRPQRLVTMLRQAQAIGGK